MLLRRVALLTAALFAVSALLTVIFAAPKDFIPDIVFSGSSLSGLRQIGTATWKAENGEITGTPSSAEGGWLVFDKGYQDAARIDIHGARTSRMLAAANGTWRTQR